MVRRIRVVQLLGRLDSVVAARLPLAVVGISQRREFRPSGNLVHSAHWLNNPNPPPSLVKQHSHSNPHLRSVKPQRNQPLHSAKPQLNPPPHSEVKLNPSNSHNNSNNPLSEPWDNPLNPHQPSDSPHSLHQCSVNLHSQVPNHSLNNLSNPHLANRPNQHNNNHNPRSVRLPRLPLPPVYPLVRPTQPHRSAVVLRKEDRPTSPR